MLFRSGGRVDEFVLFNPVVLVSGSDQRGVIISISGIILTATFFWETTIAQSFPLTPMEVMFAEVIALKAYSGGRLVSGHDGGKR